MSRKGVLLVVTLLACVGAALAIWVIGSLDKEGIPRIGRDPVVELLLLLPYVIIAGVAGWNRERGIVLIACLVAVMVIAALAIPMQWSDYERWRDRPRRREVQSMAILGVLFT